MVGGAATWAPATSSLAELQQRRRLILPFRYETSSVGHNPDVPSRATLDAFTSDNFLTGLVFGFAALAIGVLIVYVWRQWRETPVPIVGLLLTAAAMAGLQLTAEPPEDLWVGIALLAGGGALYPLASRMPLLPAALAAPGAWWVTRVVELPGAGWVPWLLFAWIVVAAPLVASFDRHFAAASYGPVLLLISVAGMFSTLPDTELILVVFGAAIAPALLAFPYGAASLGAVGVYPLLGAIAWVIAIDGHGREGAVVGAIACLALLVIEPLVRWSRNQSLLDRIPAVWWRPPAVAAAQVVVVLLAARVAGLIDSPLPAALVALAVLAGTAALLAFMRSGLPARQLE